MIGVSIVGGTGYGAGELLRMLALHPEISVVEVVSQSKAGSLIAEVHPQLAGLYEQTLVSELSVSKLTSFDHRVVVAALPHGASAALLQSLAQFISAGGIVVDLSGDFRLREEDAHRKHYPESEYLPALRNQAVYGLPELFRKQIAKARFIANPGCFATACALAAAPLVKAGIAIEHIAFDAKSGTSGGGKALKDSFHHPRRHASVAAYNALKHRHEPEIVETLAAVGQAPEISFVPHLLPISRGIHVTAHVLLKQVTDHAAMQALYTAAYESQLFVRVRTEQPEIADIVGSNFCDIAVTARGRVVVVTAVLDNLVKGMVGQAIQNINIACGSDESTGLKHAGFGII